MTNFISPRHDEPPKGQPLTLALDTASRRASVAILRGDETIAQSNEEVTTHSDRLLILIDQVLAEAEIALEDLDAMVAGRGPGSFTGLRIGMATAKGLIAATGKPLVCLSSLMGIAEPLAPFAEAHRLIVVITDAGRGQVYCGLFRDKDPQSDEHLLAPSEIHAVIASEDRPIVAGDGALKYRAEYFPDLELAPAEYHAIDAAALGRAALPRILARQFDPADAATPHYIRPPDIRRPSR